MAQISYTNKEALNENPEIANINKITDDDMNEIKQVVNDNYNNTIQITDTEPTDSDNKIWIDTGKVSSSASEITNSYSTSIGLGYSANISNGNVLYEDSNGATDDITLSDSAANYKRFKIFYKEANGFYSSTEVEDPNGKLVNLFIGFVNQSTVRFLFMASVFTINGTSMTTTWYGNGNVYNNQTTAVGNSKSIYITKVVGYKY